jgi:hypothetical protein
LLTPYSKATMLEEIRPCLLRDSCLGQEALYRVVDIVGELVEVEVVRAPGLETGTRLNFTQDAVHHMTIVDDATTDVELLRASQGRGR